MQSVSHLSASRPLKGSIPAVPLALDGTSVP